MGLRFLNLPDEMANAIDAWVNSARPDADTVDTLQNIL
jgi:hypothetical protein